MYQSESQKRLLNLYGNEMVMLDATYKTCRYALPLFFLCVKTNYSYFVVAAFVIEHETTASIIEALSFIKEWNPNLNPLYGMTDKCVQEIDALESTWEGKT